MFAQGKVVSHLSTVILVSMMLTNYRCSGDGSLSVIDIRAGKAGVDVSEDQEDELLSVESVKDGNKLVVGTQLGMLSLWAPSRGLLDHVDRIPGHPASVDALCALDRDTILTGSSDGLVRVVQILPNKLLGVVADHGGMPVERIKSKGRWLATVGHGPEVKLTDIGDLLEEGSDEEDDEREDDNDTDQVRDSAEVEDQDQMSDEDDLQKAQGSAFQSGQRKGQDDRDSEEDSDKEEETMGSFGSMGLSSSTSYKRAKAGGKGNFFADL